MTKTIRTTIDIDVSALSDECIEGIIRDMQKETLTYMVNSFNSAVVSFPATGYAEVVTRYE